MNNLITVLMVLNILKIFKKGKLINIKIIKQIDFGFARKLNTILNLKIARLYQEEDLEILVQSKKLKSKATH